MPIFLGHHLVCPRYEKSPKIDVATNYNVVDILIFHLHVINMSTTIPTKMQMIWIIHHLQTILS